MENGRIIRIIIFAGSIAISAYILAGGFLFPVEQEGSLEPPELTLITRDIQEGLNQIASVTEKASKELSSGVEGENARAVLNEAFNLTPDAVYFFTFTPDGKTITGAPESYMENLDNIASVGSLSSVLPSQGPVMTEVFIYANTPAFEIVNPVYGENGDYIGGVAALILPYSFLYDIVNPVEKSINSTFTVMQTDGLILCDMDNSQVGKNLFTDEIFSPFPNLRNLGVKFTSNSRGYGSYIYYPTGNDGGRPVKKLAYWNSAGLYGTEWRVIMFKEVLG